MKPSFKRITVLLLFKPTEHIFILDQLSPIGLRHTFADCSSKARRLLNHAKRGVSHHALGVRTGVRGDLG